MITALFAGPLALFISLLGIRVSNLRRAHRVVVGDGGHEDLALAARVHANAVENVPILLLMLLLLELLGVARWLLASLGTILVLARLSHAYGMTAKKIVFHTTGSTITFVMEIGLGAFVFVKALTRL